MCYCWIQLYKAATNDYFISLNLSIHFPQKSTIILKNVLLIHISMKSFLKQKESATEWQNIHLF